MTCTTEVIQNEGRGETDNKYSWQFWHHIYYYHLLVEKAPMQSIRRQVHRTYTYSRNIPEDILTKEEDSDSDNDSDLDKYMHHAKTQQTIKVRRSRTKHHPYTRKHSTHS